MEQDPSIYFISPFRRYVTLAVACIFSILLIWSPLGKIWPISLATIGMDMMCTFFHEIGHSVFSWVFGYPSLPSFDFQHGGGMEYHLGRISLFTWGLTAAAAYGVWFVGRLHTGLGVAAALGFVLYSAAMFTDFHNNIVLFMGNGAEIVMGSFILARVIFDAVPPRPAELEVHALAGWYLIFDPIRLSWELIFDPDARDVYWNQKGSEGFGDFSRIADYFGFVNEVPVAWFCIFMAVLGLALPFVLKWRMGN